MLTGSQDRDLINTQMYTKQLPFLTLQHIYKKVNKTVLRTEFFFLKQLFIFTM